MNPKFAKSENFRDLTVSSQKVQVPNCNFYRGSPENTLSRRRRRSRDAQATTTSRSHLQITRNITMPSNRPNSPWVGRNLAEKFAGFRRARRKFQNTTPFSTDLVNSWNLYDWIANFTENTIHYITTSIYSRIGNPQVSIKNIHTGYKP